MSQSPSASGVAVPRLANLFVGCVLIMVAITAIVAAQDFPATNLETDVGPARFPLLYSSALIVLCLVMMVGSLRQPQVPAAAPVPLDLMGSLHVAIGVLATGLCIFAMDWIGYALSTVLYLTGLMWMMGWRYKLMTPLVAIVITALLYALFSFSLNVPLPVGSLFEQTTL